MNLIVIPNGNSFRKQKKAILEYFYPEISAERLKVANKKRLKHSRSFLAFTSTYEKQAHWDGY
jgi:hypothetical protein